MKLKGETYCDGEHQCQICEKKYECSGVPVGHDMSKKGYKCHGPYIQFCENHPIEEYIEQHRKNGEL